jgi:hypothetical protein
MAFPPAQNHDLIAKAFAGRRLKIGSKKCGLKI